VRSSRTRSSAPSPETTGSTITVAGVARAGHAPRRRTLISSRTPPNPTLEAVERAYIMWGAPNRRGKQDARAEVLGIDPSTRYRKLSRTEWRGGGGWSGDSWSRPKRPVVGQLHFTNGWWSPRDSVLLRRAAERSGPLRRRRRLTRCEPVSQLPRNPTTVFLLRRSRSFVVTPFLARRPRFATTRGCRDLRAT